MEIDLAALRRLSAFRTISLVFLGGSLTLLALLLAFLQMVRPMLEEIYLSMGAKLPGMTSQVMQFPIGIAVPLSLVIGLGLILKEMRLTRKAITAWINLLVGLALLVCLALCVASTLLPLMPLHPARQ